MKKVFKDSLIKKLQSLGLAIDEKKVVKAMDRLYHFCKERDGVGNGWNIADIEIAIGLYKNETLPQGKKEEAKEVKPVIMAGKQKKVKPSKIIEDQLFESSNPEEDKIEEIVEAPKKKKTKGAIDDNHVKFKKLGDGVEKGSSFRIGKKSAVVLWGEDKHNIQLQYPGGEIEFVCVDTKCPNYSFHEHKVEEL